jgi:DNA primase
MHSRNRALDLLDLSARYYHEVLLRSNAAEEARQYLKTRGLLPVTVDLFALGHAPDSWDSLLNFLVSKNYTPKEVFEAGLAVRRERGDGYYDRFRGRIMFPIKDLHGHVVGFTARILPSQEANQDAGGKYINTPQTDFYNKSRVLY